MIFKTEANWLMRAQAVLKLRLVTLAEVTVAAGHELLIEVQERVNLILYQFVFRDVFSMPGPNQREVARSNCIRF